MIVNYIITIFKFIVKSIYTAFPLYFIKNVIKTKEYFTCFCQVPLAIIVSLKKYWYFIDFLRLTYYNKNDLSKR